MWEKTSNFPTDVRGDAMVRNEFDRWIGPSEKIVRLKNLECMNGDTRRAQHELFFHLLLLHIISIAKILKMYAIWIRNL